MPAGARGTDPLDAIHEEIPKPWLILMIKASDPGRVKTRLAVGVGTEEAVRIYRRCVEYLVGILMSAESNPWQPVVVYSPREREKEIRKWLSPLCHDGVLYRPQVEGDLGERLAASFSEAFATGAPAALALGADCVELEPREIEAALEELKSHDVVIGEAHDGGYWTIGLSSLQRDLFVAMPWSEPGLAEATREAAARLGLSLAQMPKKRDIDTVEDLRKLTPEVRLRLGITDRFTDRFADRLADDPADDDAPGP